MNRVGDKTIALLLLAAFQTRYKEVLIKAQTAAMTVAPKFLTLLTKEETKCEIIFVSYIINLHLCYLWMCINLMLVLCEVYEAAQSSMAAFKKWRMGGPRFQRASVLGRKKETIGLGSLSLSLYDASHRQSFKSISLTLSFGV